MGACSSQLFSVRVKRGSIRKGAATNAALQAKIQVALQTLMAEQAKLENPMTFERILLKFDHLQDGKCCMQRTSDEMFVLFLIS